VRIQIVVGLDDDGQPRERIVGVPAPPADPSAWGGCDVLGRLDSAIIRPVSTAGMRSRIGAHLPGGTPGRETAPPYRARPAWEHTVRRPSTGRITPVTGDWGDRPMTDAFVYFNIGGESVISE
jgi:hypothetical protein